MTAHDNEGTEFSEDLSEFAIAVTQDIRNQNTDQEAEELRATADLQAWREEIINIINAIDAQLSSSKADRSRKTKEFLDYMSFRNKWRASALGFKRLALARLTEVNQMMRATSEEPVEITVVRLQDAIRHHKEVVDGKGETTEAEGADKALWAVLPE